MSASMPEGFLSVNGALGWVWEEEHKQQLGTAPSEMAFIWLRLYRWLERHNYTVQDGTRTIQLDKDTTDYLKEGDRLFTGGNYERIWNLSLVPLSHDLRIAIREAWQAGAIPGGPGLQPEDKQYDGPVPDYAHMTAWRPPYTQIESWLERWWEQGERGSTQCWNCRHFTIPIGGEHYCTMHSSQVDYLSHCQYWEARRSI